MTALARLKPVFKHCKVCKADYTRDEWEQLELELSPSAPQGVTNIQPKFDKRGHMVKPARKAVWRHCPPPCCNTLVDLEER
jgi:hypothetical protein